MAVLSFDGQWAKDIGAGRAGRLQDARRPSRLLQWFCFV